MSEAAEPLPPLSPPDESPPMGDVIDMPPPEEREPRPRVSGRKRGRPRKVVDAASGPPPPFDGGPPREAREAGAREPRADSAASATAAMRAVMADPEKAGKMLVGIVDGLLGMLANTRYGALVDPESGKRLVELMAVTSEERDELTGAVVLFLKASSIQLSPGANLAVAFGGIYGVRALGLEASRSAIRKAQRGA